MTTMWRTKTFKSREAMSRWLKRQEGRIQYQEVFVNNAFAVEWRWLRRIG
jgi:hypothetical protein